MTSVRLLRHVLCRRDRQLSGGLSPDGLVHKRRPRLSGCPGLPSVCPCFCIYLSCSKISNNRFINDIEKPEKPRAVIHYVKLEKHSESREPRAKQKQLSSACDSGTTAERSNVSVKPGTSSHFIGIGQNVHDE